MIGKMINNIRKEKKMSLQKLSTLTGIDVGHLCHIENGQRNPSYKALKSICTALGVSGEQFATYTGQTLNEKQEEYGYVKYIPYNKVPLVNLIEFVERPKDCEGNLMCIIVDDDSMEKQYMMGSNVFIDTGTPLDSGDLGLFLFNNRIMLREIKYNGSKTLLKAYNKEYEDITVKEDDKFYIIGKVVK